MVDKSVGIFKKPKKWKNKKKKKQEPSVAKGLVPASNVTSPKSSVTTFKSKMTETRSERMRRSSLEEKRRQDKLKRLFLSSMDPYDRPAEWWEQPTVKYALTYLPVKNRLEKLMGSCVVRLTDRKYMTKLMAKIREDYEASQEARIRDRKWQELMRTKNMILNRFISIEEADAEILEYPLFQLYKYCDSLERRVKKPSPKKVRISTSLYDLLYPSKPDGAEEEGEGEDDAPMKEVVVDGERQMVPLSPEELREYREKQELQRDIDNGYMYSQEDFESLHYEAETIKKLKATKTVDDMYTKAHEIVGVLYSFGPNEKHKRCELDDAASVMTADSRANADFAADQKSEEDPEEEEQESGNEEPAPERQPVQQSEDGPPSP